MKNKIEIYQRPDKQTEIQVQFDKDPIWLSQLQMAELFDKDARTINEHIKIFLTPKNLLRIQLSGNSG